MQDKHEPGPLTFGFDIGIASVGWCVLGENSIVDLGVRCFDPGEDSDGKPHNQTRRGARVARNRLDMRRWRLRQLLRLFCDVGLIPAPDPQLLMPPPRAKNSPGVGPWQLRAEGLERKLDPIEWARVLYHLVKHRGFEFFRRSDIRPAADSDIPNPESNEESGGSMETMASAEASSDFREKQKLSKALEDTSKLLEKYRKPLEDYRGIPLTIGALAVWLSAEDYAPGEPRPDDFDRKPFLGGAFRNKQKSYRHAFLRAALRHELQELFAAQIKYQNPFADLPVPVDGDYLKQMLSPNTNRLSPSQTIPVGGDSREIGRTFQEAVFDLFDMQHPPLYADQVREMVGECELVEGQPRASKNSFSAERATWLEILNKIHIRRNGPESLSPQERACLMDLPYLNRVVTLKLVRETLMTHTGFPASWQEASFNVATYQAKPASDGAWLYVVQHGGEPIGLAKWADSKDRKKRLSEAKKMLTGGVVTFRQLREHLGLSQSDRFIYRIKETRIIPRDKESMEHISFAPQGAGICAPGQYFRYVRGNGKPKSLPKAAWKLLADLRSLSAATLADWRTVLGSLDEMSGVWQFEHSAQTEKSVEVEDEARATVPLQYEDAQAVEAAHKLVELKGWHALRQALAEQSPGRWEQLQAAYRSPASEAGQQAAKNIDDIATILTECQTDHEIGQHLCNRGFTDSEIAALQTISFSKFRNLSLVALHKILPHLETGHVYSKACELAGLRHSEKPAADRTRKLPRLETYVYQRYRHGRPTGHVEKRYKELRNPVVARSFNQARLVFNALVDKHGSPAYVHVETARDLARSKKLRVEIQREQETNRKRMETIRKELTAKLGHDPSAIQLLKARLYGEQAGQCIYTGRELNFGEILRDEEYVEIDHIWPRSKTFDNSLNNKVMVMAGANRDKGDQTPYEFLDGRNSSLRWREFEKRVLACKGLSAEKQRRLLSKSLEDADEFLARNLVDTRFVTRMFANMLRERVEFAGAPTADELEAISPDVDGTTRWNRYQRARVRSPQGRLVDFLRGKWGLGHAKDRETSDLHHALDACIIAACNPKVIQRVNNYFAQEEKEPNSHRFKRNHDGTYTQRTGDRAGEIISKAEARERGLYLPAPWDNFHRDLLSAMKSVFVSRRPKRKSVGELHDANPKGIRFLPVPLIDLTEDMLSDERMREIKGRRRKNMETLRLALTSAMGDARTVFENGYEVRGANDKPKLVTSIALPLWSLPDDYLVRRKKALAQTNRNNRANGIAEVNENVTSKSRVSIAVRKTTPLTELSAKMLTEAELGSAFYRRNKALLLALRNRLAEFANDPKKAFADPFRPPPSKSGKDRPIIRSIRLPQAHGSGILVRGGITGLGDSIAVEVYWTANGYFLRPRYQARSEDIFGIAEAPAGAIHKFNLRIDEPVEVTLNDEERTVVPGNGFPGYFVGYENDGRITIRAHDRPGKSRRKRNTHDLEKGATVDPDPLVEANDVGEPDKSLFRFSVSTIKVLKKFKVDALGNWTELHSRSEDGLA